MAKRTFRDLLSVEGPLVLPGAYDALSARLIEQAGFPGYFIGGFPVVGARYGVPDVGLKGLGEISDAVADIVAAYERAAANGDGQRAPTGTGGRGG